tara:strand:+ start:551 stop:1891 length:1341 start_codon:yes stop_codon:yes gene_type:complete
VTPGARIQEAMELLDEVWQKKSPPDVIVRVFFRKRRYAGSSDRQFIQDYVYAILRRRARLDWWIRQIGLCMPSQTRSRMIAYLALVCHMTPDEIAERFSGHKYCPRILITNEFKLTKALHGQCLNNKNMPLSVTNEYPTWLKPDLENVWQDKLGDEIAALNTQAPVDVRVNSLKTTRDEAALMLANASIETQKTEFSPLGLRIFGTPRLTNTSAYKQGLIEIQDEGAQLVSMLCDAKPGMNVIDYCAGAGGKTLALAGAMARNGKIFGNLIACDISLLRLDRLQARLKRAGATDVKCQTIKTEDNDQAIHRKVRADRVLIDVPCTGTGIWRRDPNAKWRLTPAEVMYYVEQQQLIMKKAATLVKPGGRLIYVTCSLLQRENENQVTWFLNENPNFEIIPITDIWSEAIGGACPSTEACLRLTPFTTGTDGFFCAIVKLSVSHSKIC